MSKSIILLSILLVSLNAYKLYTKDVASNEKTLKDIDWPFTICGDGTWTPQSLSLAQKPARSTNDDITVTGTANDDISFTTVFLEVKLNGAFLHSESIDFKKSVSAGDTVQFKFANYVPGFAPPGTYSLSLTFKVGDKANGCIAFQFKL